MIITIDSNKIENANEFGELLRGVIFDTTPCYTLTGFHTPLGCYETFNLNPNINFERIFSGNIYNTIKRLLGCLDLDKEIFIFTNRKSVHVGWYWDGDGDLVIMCDGKIVENTDCKCDNTWEWINEKSGWSNYVW